MHQLFDKQVKARFWGDEWVLMEGAIEIYSVESDNLVPDLPITERGPVPLVRHLRPEPQNVTPECALNDMLLLLCDMNEHCLVLLIVSIYLRQLTCAVNSHINSTGAMRYVCTTGQLCMG